MPVSRASDSTMPFGLGISSNFNRLYADNVAYLYVFCPLRDYNAPSQEGRDMPLLLDVALEVVSLSRRS